MAKTKAQAAERAAAGLCINNPSHAKPRGIQTCDACAETDARMAMRRRRRIQGLAQAEITKRSFFEALQDLYYAGKLGLRR